MLWRQKQGKRGTGNKRRKIIKYKEIQRRETFHTREISSRWAAKANVQQPHYLIHALRKFKFHVLTSTSQLTSSKKLRTSSDDGWRQTGATTLSLTESFRQILVMCMSHTHMPISAHTKSHTAANVGTSFRPGLQNICTYIYCHLESDVRAWKVKFKEYGAAWVHLQVAENVISLHRQWTKREASSQSQNANTYFHKPSCYRDINKYRFFFLTVLLIKCLYSNYFWL